MSLDPHPVWARDTRIVSDRRLLFAACGHRPELVYTSPEGSSECLPQVSSAHRRSFLVLSQAASASTLLH